MQKPITKRQKDLLDILYEFIKDTGYPPTFEEMRERLGVASNQSVIDHLAQLERAGLVRRSESAARGISMLPAAYEMLGSPALVGFAGMTSAGAPIETVAITGEWREVGGEVARFAEDVFMLKVSGDSMINAGIEDGDVVLVQSKKEFVSGEIVYAQIGDGGTIKRFISQDKPPFIYLKPENPKHANVSFTDDTEIKGKVISVLKNNYWKSII